MENKENKTKLYMQIFLSGMVIVSLVTAWIMAKNLNQDESKERFKLTTDYKRIKKEDYQFNAEKGQQLYNALCLKCHGVAGMGNVQNPPLNSSLIVRNAPKEMLKIIVKGLRGEISRNGKKYNSVMPSFKAIGNHDLAHISNYIRIVINNNPSAEVIHPVEVVKTKIDTLTIKRALTPKDLKQEN